jgi:hypothetical protein
LTYFILDLKVQLANRATRLANKILEAFATDLRESNQGTRLSQSHSYSYSLSLSYYLGMSSKYEAMLIAIAVQPKTPEEWDEACKYLNFCEKEISDMLVLFERTKTVWEVSFRLNMHSFI